MKHWPAFAALLLAALLGACEKDAQSLALASASASAAAPAPPAKPIARAPVAAEAAYDLGVLSDGALLAVGERGGGVSVLLLDHRGAQRGAPLRAFPASDGIASEVAVTAQGTKMAVAWSARAKDGSRSIWATLGDAATRAFSDALPLGETSSESAARGSVALAATEAGGFVAVRRGPDEPCNEDPSRHCAGYGFRELLPTGSEPRGLPMAVPVPCAVILAGLVVVQGRWHYGFCSQAEGRPQTTHFMRQLSPFFVEVHRSFEGCVPLGATSVDDDALFAADCPDGRRGVRVNGMGQALRSVDLAHVEVSCERGAPVIRAPGEAPIELALKEPRAGLSVLLPARLAPGNTRSVWTGTTLLSAAWVAGEVALRRYECSGRELVAR